MNPLTIIIVHYNTKSLLEECVDSIYGQTQCAFETVIIDNGSADRDFSKLTKRHTGLRLIQNEENLGFSRACNQGLKARPAQFYLLLNPDCIVEDDAIGKTLDFLSQHPEAGIATCRVNNPDGSLQKACRRQIPRPATAFFRLAGLDRIFPRSPTFARYNLSHLPADEIHEVEAVSGSFLMFGHRLLEDIGDLDESFFLYGEDLDFCFRAGQRGWKILYFPQAHITHHKRSSSSQHLAASTIHFYEAMEIFYQKHFAAESSRLEQTAVVAAIRLLYRLQKIRQSLLGHKGVGSVG